MQRLHELEKLIEVPDLWNDPVQAQKITKEHSRLKKEIELVEELQSEANELADWIEPPQEDSGRVPEPAPAVTDAAQLTSPKQPAFSLRPSRRSGLWASALPL